MTESGQTKAGKTAKPAESPAADSGKAKREARLAAALRENLRRRKSNPKPKS